MNAILDELLVYLDQIDRILVEEALELKCSLQYFCITVIGGERWCVEEILAKVQPSDYQISPGCVLVQYDGPPEVFRDLRTVERVGISLIATQDFPFSNPLSYLQSVQNDQTKFTSAQQIWRAVVEPHCFAFNNPSVSKRISKRLERDKIPIHLDTPSYRILCRRRNCVMKAPAIADEIEYTKEIKLETNYATPDLEIFVDVFRENFLVGLTLFADLHKRQFKAGFFGGKTCLNPAVGNVIARAANLQLGEVVWDPMCGSGSLLFQACELSPHSIYIGSDIDLGLLDKCRENATIQGHNISLFFHNATLQSMKDNSVDVVLADMPFGIRHSSHHKNRDLYPRFLKKLRLVLAPGGRAFLLTGEANIMRRYLEGNRQFKPYFDDYSIDIDVSGATCKLWCLQKVFKE